MTSNNVIDLLDYLSRWRLEFGILDSDREITVEVNILNTDNKINIRKMKLKDVMFFTEYGTITIPGKFILEKSLVLVNKLIDIRIGKLIDDIFEEDKNETYIQNQMNRLALNIQDLVRNTMISYIKHTNRLGEIIHKGEDENKYLYDLIKLKNYVRCVAKFEN